MIPTLGKIPSSCEKTVMPYNYPNFRLNVSKDCSPASPRKRGQINESEAVSPSKLKKQDDGSEVNGVGPKMSPPPAARRLYLEPPGKRSAEDSPASYLARCQASFMFFCSVQL